MLLDALVGRVAQAQIERQGIHSTIRREQARIVGPRLDAGVRFVALENFPDHALIQKVLIFLVPYGVGWDAGAASKVASLNALNPDSTAGSPGFSQRTQ